MSRIKIKEAIKDTKLQLKPCFGMLTAAATLAAYIVAYKKEKKSYGEERKKLYWIKMGLIPVMLLSIKNIFDRNFVPEEEVAEEEE